MKCLVFTYLNDSCLWRLAVDDSYAAKVRKELGINYDFFGLCSLIEWQKLQKDG